MICAQGLSPFTAPLASMGIVTGVLAVGADPTLLAPSMVMVKLPFNSVSVTGSIGNSLLFKLTTSGKILCTNSLPE